MNKVKAFTQVFAPRVVLLSVLALGTAGIAYAQAPTPVTDPAPTATAPTPAPASAPVGTPDSASSSAAAPLSPVTPPPAAPVTAPVTAPLLPPAPIPGPLPTAAPTPLPMAVPNPAPAALPAAVPPAPSIPASTPVASTGLTCTPGARLFVFDDDAWYGATAIDATVTTKLCAVRFDGYGPEEDKAISLTNARVWSLDGPGTPVKECVLGGRVIGLVDGVWYPGSVLGVSAKGCKLRFDDKEVDEETLPLSKVRTLP